MKKVRNQVIKRFSAFFLSLSLLAGAGISSHQIIVNNSPIEVDAIGNYTTNASTYYNSITATSGKELAAQLHDLITSTHLHYTSYDDNGSNGYQKYTDQYYENGKKVSGYIYEFYSGVKWPNAWAATAGNTSGGYNREHCWCQSNSVNNNGIQMWGTNGGGSDMHHIRPVEVRLNSTRNDNEYGEISIRDNNKVYAKYGSNLTYAHGGYYSSGTFEPLDSKKGDVARIILYTYLHYNSYTVSTLFGSYGTTNGNASSSYFSSSLLSLTKITNKSTESAALTMLLDWNTNDPVDDIERRRNEQVAIYQGNRNPFIDNSTYADAIWGNSGITSISKTNVSLLIGGTTTISAVSKNGGNISWSTSDSSICSISSNSSSSGSNITLTAGSIAGSATITASITINGINYSKTCSVVVSVPKTLDSIAVSDAKTSYETTDTFQRPTVTATYTDTTTADVSFSATFTGYDLTTTGSQTVTASYTEGSITKTATYTITVSEATNKDYQKVTSINDITNNNRYLIVGYKSSTSTYYGMPNYTSGNNIQGVTVTLTQNNTLITSANKSTSTVVTLISTGNSNEYYLQTSDDNYLYAAGSGTSNYLKSKSTTDSSKGAFTISYSNNTFSVVAASDNRNTLRFNSTNTLFACYADNTSQTEIMFFKEIEQSEATLSSITLDTTDVQTSFAIGDTFNCDGLIVVAHYDNGFSEDLDSYDITPPDMSTSGQKTVTVSSGSVSATYNISVLESGSTTTGSYTWDLTIASYNTPTSSEQVTWNADCATMVTDKSSSGNPVNSYLGGDSNNRTSSRFYKTNTLTFTPKLNYQITSVVYTATSEGYATALGESTWNNASASVSSTVVTITPTNGSISFSAIISATTGSTQVKVNYIKTYSQPSLSWAEPTLKVYSNEVLTSDIVNEWSVEFNDGFDSITELDSTQIDIKLDDTLVELPYTWTINDHDKELKVEYLEVSSTIVIVDVTQSIRPVYQHIPEDKTFSVTKSISVGDVVYLATNKTGNELGGISTTQTKYGTLSSFSDGKPTKVYPLTVCNGYSEGTFAFKNSDNKYLYWGSSNSLNVNSSLSDNTSWSISIDSNGNATILNSADSTRQISFNARSGMQRFAAYANPTINDSGSENHNVQLWKEEGTEAQDILISNMTGHEDAQKLVVEFAESFNEAMDSTNNCSSNMSTAWTAASNAWNEFLANVAELDEDEESYAKLLIASAYARWTLGTDSDFSYCLERCLATYEYCVTHHGQTAFMSSVRSVSGSALVSSFVSFTKEGNIMPIIIMISIISVAAVGGYFLLRRRKEN